MNPIATSGPSNYIELAHRTSAPTGPVIQRLQQAGNQIDLRNVLTRAVTVGVLADQMKRRIFYGKGDTPPTDRPNMLGPIPAEASKLLQDEKIAELFHAGIGMLTEAGEFLEALLNHVFHGEPLDEHNLKEELGDNQWYVAKGCKFLGTTIETEQDRNIAKLRARYPDKFTEDSAVNRDLGQERMALEHGGKADVYG